jgi:alkylation response protein AidB-like acyl-CoA dehydrogenase
MDFEFSPEQEMLRASVRGFLADRAPLTAVRSEYDAPTFTRTVWDGLRDLGLVDLGMVDAAVVLEELGRACCPAPYASSVIGAASLLPELVTRATRASDGWTVDGVKVHVPDAAMADVFVVTACDDAGELGVFRVADARTEPTRTVDGSRKQGRLVLDGANATRVECDPHSAIASALDRLGVAYVVDGVGAAQRALELAVEYAKQRVQFSKPIGSFQAVQHLCADMLRTVELGRAAGYYACWALDEAGDAEAHRAATLARAFAADAFPQLGGTAIQVFGGVGFTWEHDIHLFYKRLLTLSVALGTATEHLEELAALAID